jgi:hypothetical protein
VEPRSCTDHNPGHGGRYLGIVRPFPLLQLEAEHDETRRELEVISKKAGIAELEWEHQRK